MAPPVRDGRVRVLPPETARKIAAGEVVDRPAAVVRELVDNAIDAGASKLEVAVQGGGARSVEVSDDGRGMEREDLELCWLPHATSKIRTDDDLLSVETLGFRGEALSAVSAAARLEIVTSREGGDGWKLAVGPAGGSGAEARIEPARRARGTTTRALGLFDAIPARKRFLKRDGAEALLCRQALLDKALAFPAVEFRYVQDGELKLFLPAVATLRERFAAALPDAARAAFLHEIAASGEGFSLAIVVGGPELSRGDRRQQYVFANGRRIQDFGFQQALEYGTQGWFPNGTHPVGAVFIDVDPSLADFNIHPAKREARFKDSGAIHRAAVAALRDFMRRLGLAQAERRAAEARTFDFAAAAGDALSRGRPAQPGGSAAGARSAAEPAAAYAAREPFGAGAARGFASDRPAARAALEALLDDPPDFAPLPRPAGPEGGVRVLGTAFGLFIVAQKDSALYLIDQHAAHERILFDALRAKPRASQELLVPLPFRADSADDDAFLRSRSGDLAELGVRVAEDGDGAWRLEALPEGWRASDEETVRAILDLRNAGEDLAERWLATMACKAAVKDGDPLDGAAAREIAEKALALPVPRCPHGRPVWMEIGLEQVLRAVRRT